MRRAASRWAPQIAKAILVSSGGLHREARDHETTHGEPLASLADSRDQHQHQHREWWSAKPENANAPHQPHR